MYWRDNDEKTDTYLKLFGIRVLRAKPSHLLWKQCNSIANLLHAFISRDTCSIRRLHFLPDFEFSPSFNNLWRRSFINNDQRLTVYHILSRISQKSEENVWVERPRTTNRIPWPGHRRPRIEIRQGGQLETQHYTSMSRGWHLVLNLSRTGPLCGFCLLQIPRMFFTFDYFIFTFKWTFFNDRWTPVPLNFSILNKDYAFSHRLWHARKVGAAFSLFLICSKITFKLF